MNRSYFSFFSGFSAVAISLCAAAACALFAACGFPGMPPVDSAAREARAVVAAMTLDEKASQTLMAGISGKERFTPALKDHFQGTVPGAILLFKYNIASSPEAVHGFISSCDSSFESLGSRVPVAFAIDNEGGDVYRTGSLTFRLPSAHDVASRLDPKESERLYSLSARELSLMGIRMNLAPVVETLTPENSEFLGTRSWSDDPAVVARYSAAAIRGNRKGGMISVLKHFPGTGAGDPHRGDSVIGASAKDFERDYVAPFRRLIAERPEAILVSHCIVPAVDPDTPFCVSKKGVTGILRQKLKYTGVVITDDISMRALSSRGLTSGNAAVLALRAGCDMVMTSDGNIRAIRSAIVQAASDDEVFAARLDEAVARIVEMKIRSGIPFPSDTDGGPRSFDASAFSAARSDGEKILEAMNGKK